MPFVVQFPHPGSEHVPSPPAVGTLMDWNVGHHKRKFLVSDGEYLAGDVRRGGRICFWGEWEAPSDVVRVWPKQGRSPRFLHEPTYGPPPGTKHQNSDPLVFGSPWLYTNCKQIKNSKLRKLTPGSVILFGSGQGAGFVLDTVFVVGEGAQPYELGETGVVPQNRVSDAVVFGPLGTTRHAGQGCVAYRAAMHGDRSDGLHSWLPCRPDGEDPRFQRPLLHPDGPLADIIQPKLFMGARVRSVSEQQAVDVWNHVVQVCEREGLVRGMSTTAPATASVPAAPAPTASEARGSC